MSGQFNDETQGAVRDAFAAFDTQGTGRIPAEAFMTIMQSFGHTVTEAEVKPLVSHTPGQPSGVEYATLLQTLAKKAQGATNSENEVLEAFQVFDKDNDGLIAVSEFRHIMTRMGNPLTDAEVDEMMREAGVAEGGSLDYRVFTQIMFS
ncbi:hypothetical protein H4R18_005132 [Coemansia javaensis]|uniref:EF-hand domain-containing protein n=1 Tax=Coemansia javaensis TaxID=2761396 RepID=A0A9W8LFA9_9FUNG|nr:hypothetical protein H4R18_005132 [Coemansia javaensis]